MYICEYRGPPRKPHTCGGPDVPNRISYTEIKLLFGKYTIVIILFYIDYREIKTISLLKCY